MKVIRILCKSNGFHTNLKDHKIVRRIPLKSIYLLKKCKGFNYRLLDFMDIYKLHMNPVNSFQNHKESIQIKWILLKII